MLRAFFLSIGQFGDRAFLIVFAKSLAITFALFILLGGGAWWWAQGLAATQGAEGWLSALAGFAALVAVFAAGWLLFRAIAVGVLMLFVEEIVVAVERKHYPQALAEARHVGMGRAALMGLASAARAILVNVVVLPLYIVLLVTGVGTVALFVVVNGWLLGRDLAEMVAARHLPAAAMRGWRKATAWQRFTLGVAGTGLFMVPILNLAAPVLGAAMATHLFHGRKA
ncbi:EI24 domain-containing protein [Sphingomonas sp. BAUL-RG-20F-R05-02]|uniref:EI24 domain-containing protein n=1 Tax=Sphingomonas sp. BAUL-RG-20F-R05-02 TaxID=2914830 RepID=UPI001F58DFFC|nr:EI24 domain-containing protein [Sphingomonas sp. BAUL-RG-20F-R05-02]